MIPIILLASYLIGSLPFGLWLGLACCHVDLRDVGSGNIGATNAWRVLGWKVGFPVFALDLAKGIAPVVMANHFGRDIIGSQATFWSPASLSVAAGLSAILGHNFSPFLKFKGGKGVATSFGVAIAMSPLAGLAGFLTWLFFLSLTRMISISSLIGTPVGAYFIWYFNGKSLPFGVFGILATLFVVIKHIPNMKRLAAGTELKIDPLLPTIKRFIARANHSGSVL
jgi:glycerol-3-phosphate acyltransferase PlsY